MINEHWTKSTYSTGGDSNCVEARSDVDTVDVRDTQNRDAGHLSFPTREWSAALRAMRSDEL